MRDGHWYIDSNRLIIAGSGWLLPVTAGMLLFFASNSALGFSQGGHSDRKP